MTISKALGTCMLLGLVVATTLYLTPAIVFAEGGEPHNCEGYNAYDPPPYFGNVTVNYCEFCTANEDGFWSCSSGSEFWGCAILSGRVVQAGGDSEVINLNGTLYEAAATTDDFLSHTQHDIRGRCIIGPAMGRNDLGAYEIVGAHSLVYKSNTKFTVDIIVMPLTTR